MSAASANLSSTRAPNFTRATFCAEGEFCTGSKSLAESEATVSKRPQATTLNEEKREVYALIISIPTKTIIPRSPPRWQHKSSWGLTFLHHADRRSSDPLTA